MCERFPRLARKIFSFLTPQRGQVVLDAGCVIDQGEHWDALHPVTWREAELEVLLVSSRAHLVPFLDAAQRRFDSALVRVSPLCAWSPTDFERIRNALLPGGRLVVVWEGMRVDPAAVRDAALVDVVQGRESGLAYLFGTRHRG